LYLQFINYSIFINHQFLQIMLLFQAAVTEVLQPEVIQKIPLTYYLYFASALFILGIIGVLTRRNAIIVFMSVELMLNAVNILLVAFSAYKGDPAGQIFVFFIMAVAAAEVAVGLAIIVMIYRNIQSIDIGLLDKLKW
jgi:NADH-quinone oxidoreductase subunit K